MNEENRRAIEDCYDELKKIKEWIHSHQLHTNVKFLVAYAVIKSSSTIEVVFKSMIHSFLAEECKEETRLFLEKNIIDASYNASTGMMQRLLEQFDPSKVQLFCEVLKGTKEKGDLNSLINLRNDVAHGRDISVSINIIEEYFKSGEKVINQLESLL